MRPILGSVLARTFGSTYFAKDIDGVDREALLTMARALLEERPRTRAELGPLLAERWPDRVATSLAQAATYLIPVVQVTPRGLWQKKGPAAWTTIEKLARPSARTGRVSRRAHHSLPRRLRPGRPEGHEGLVGTGRSGRSGQANPPTASAPSGTNEESSCSTCRMRPGPIRTRRHLPGFSRSTTTFSSRTLIGLVFSRVIWCPRAGSGICWSTASYVGSWKIERSKGSVRLDIELGRKLPRSDLVEVTAEGSSLLNFTDPTVAERDVRIDFQS